MVHAKRCDAKVQKFHFLKKKLPGELTGVSNSNVGLCLHKGARGIVEIEARERITRYTTKSDGPRPGDCYHGGLTVLSCSACGATVVTVLTATTALFSQPGTVNTVIVSYCCLAMHYCLAPASVLCMLRPTNKHGHDGPTVRAVAH